MGNSRASSRPQRDMGPSAKKRSGRRVACHRVLAPLRGGSRQGAKKMLLDSFQRALIAQGRSVRTVDAYLRAVRILSSDSGKNLEEPGVLLTAADVWKLLEGRPQWSQAYLKQI